MSSAAAITLRPDQVEAVDAVVRGLDIPPGKRIPRNGLRATVVAACGTGKTIIAASSALRLARNGRVLVLVPTLDLLTQTIGEWRSVGHTGLAVAVCSLADDPQLVVFDVRSTTNPIQLALWHGVGPVTVYATYASLPVLAKAMEGAYGQQLAPFDLVVVDEAHRTSGSAGKSWAVIHDNEVIPALRRLYMTATPRIWQERPRSRDGVWDPLPEELACSMDDPKIFGPVVYELSLASAVSRGLLARYQIVVAELRDPVVTPERLAGGEGREEQVRGERMGALQAALLETMATHRLRTTITFHHRTREAEAFAEGLPRVAKRLHAADSQKYPKQVWADWLCGEHEADHRRAVLADFGRRAGRAVLSNCRVLGEGVDIRAVDSVALLDPKGSPVEIVQAIGRALRQKPQQGKLATLIVPVFLAADERPEDMFTSTSYRPLVKVLAGLRAHDERAVELLAIPQENQRAVVDPSLGIGVAPESDDEEEARLLLRFAAPRDPVLIAQWVKFEVLHTERRDWRCGYEAAQRCQQREGSLDVPYDHVEGAYPLGRWLSEQRRSMRAGTMESRRAEDLEALGMVWDTADAAFGENLAAARAYLHQAGTLAAPRHATALDKPIGQWLTNIRRPGGLGKDPERAQRRAAQLAAIDPDWNPRELGWTVDWQRHFAGLRALIEAGGTLKEVQPGVTYHGNDIGQWLVRQVREWERLGDGQRLRLKALGVRPAQRSRKALQQPRKGPVRPAAAPTHGHVTAGAGAASDAFTRGLAALRQYVKREQRTVVSRQHAEQLPDGTVVRLGVWLSNQKTRRDRLDHTQLAALAHLGYDWA
ncbi:DEAD/DEAH box helicase [Streptomyces piniterrae]|uniref:DEAD/DEAH box helicase n=1 Tax=Streptomyces piniterrae TaxID=2571125 RepID=A0A4U0N4X1_9ACTN|nr:DEAD/DEAH box helicase [Streptomyces piniterrae]TJZ44654.1 DEAD/DEAH box helicase [Streptomyces piniterrae]